MVTDKEFEESSDYIKYRLNCIHEIYFSPPFTKDSNFYRRLQEYNILNFDNKYWKIKLKYQ